MADTGRNAEKRRALPSAGRSGSSLFLLELIITIGFFAITGAVCIQLFLAAHRISVSSREKAEAVRIAQNTAECFLAADGEPEMFAKLLELALDGAGPLQDMNVQKVYFDGDFCAVQDSAGAAYMMELETEKQEDLYTLALAVCTADGREIFSLETAELAEQEGGR